MAARRRVAAVACAVAVLAGAACSGSDDTPKGDGVATTSTVAAPVEGVLRIGTTAIESLDPADVVLTDQPALILADLLFDGLVAPAPAGDPIGVVPALASAWEVDDDGTTWTFTLTEGRTFADGSPVTATDAVFSLERVARQGSASLSGVRLEVIEGYRAFLDGSMPTISGLRAVDERTLEIQTRVPYQPLLELLASPAYGVVPKATAEANLDGFLREPVASGPYELTAREDGVVQLGLRTAGAGLVEGAVAVTEVQVLPFADDVAAYEAFQSGSVDWAQVPVHYLDEESDESGGRLVADPFHAEFFLGFNLTSPTFADERFREAIVRAIDRGKIASSFVTGGLVLDGPVVEGASGASPDPCGTLCVYDPERAKALVSEVFGTGPLPEVPVDFYEGEAEEAIAEAVVADLKAAGIPAVVRVRPFEEYRSFVVSGEQGLFGFGWVGVAPDGESYLGPLFESGSPDNVTGIASLQVDAAIGEARAVADPIERVAAYAGIEQLVMNELPIVPLVQVRTHVALSERVGGYQQRLDGTFVVAGLTAG